jgi:hypothetical protein
MTDDVTEPDEELEIEDWDADDSWVTAVGDDEFAFDLPSGVGRLLARRLKRGSKSFSNELAIEVNDDDTVRELEADEISGLIDDASTVVRDALRSTLQPEEMVGVTQAAAVLATIWSMSFDAEAADGSATRREQIWVAVITKLAQDCEHMLFARIRPRPDGTFSLRWRGADRAIVQNMSAELRGLLASDDPSISRLFPSAYGSDAERNAGWDALMRGELIEKRLEALAVVDELMGRDRCTADELNAFMRSVNDARLVLGTRLDVDESGMPADLTGADRAAYETYEHLGFLLAVTIRALRGTL